MTTLDSSTAGIISTVARVRASYGARVTRPLEWRRAQLEAMIAMLEENESRWSEALRQDLGKPTIEGFITDIAFVTGEIGSMIKNLKKWNKPERVGSPVVTQPSRSLRIPEPLGTVLVIAPWNYPIQLLLVPAAGAIAAGNAVVMKPSEVSGATSKLLAELCPRYLDTSAVALVEGGVPETTTLLEQTWDHIFYTGNGSVGRIVMAAAARNLTPVTLELGGKSPVIIDETANLRVAARRVAWGKWLNAGQTCIAPDYVLVNESVRAPFIDEVQKAITEFYGNDPHASTDYGRIVSQRHYERLAGMLGSGRAAVGGDAIADDRYISPTVLVDVDMDSKLMDEEIFGPLLPVIPVSSVDEAVSFVNARPHPLALYVFSENRNVVDMVLDQTTSGGVTVNGTLMHITNPNLPFGGIGESGMGAYHGKSSVRLFQHMKPVLKRGTKMDPSLAYPPYTQRKARIFRRFL